jgi:hypothetical protein
MRPALGTVSSQLRPNPPPEGLPTDDAGARLAVCALLLLVLAALLLLARELRRRRPVVPPSADEWARQALDDIARLGLPAAGEIERFHTLVCDVLRQYLERRFELPVSRQTTVEFLERMHELPALTEAQRKVLQDLMRHFDLAKFAQARVTPAQCDDLLAAARRLIDETSARRTGEEDHA